MNERTGELIRKLREEKGLSQRQLGNIVHVTRQAVSNWELGHALPESSVMLALSEFFGVSINELLGGKIKEKVEKENTEIEEQKLEVAEVEDIKVEKEELETIALKWVDEYNAKSRKLKKLSQVFIFSIFTFTIAFLVYYFITSYNSIKVYKIEGKGKDFFTYNGILVSTKQKSYIRLGKLQSDNENLEIKKVKLYYFNEDGNQQVLYEDSISDILLTDYYGYSEYFPYKDLKYVINNLHIEIMYDNNKTETLKLKIEKDFSNNLLFYNKKNNIIDDKVKYTKISTFTNIIVEKIKEKGKKESDSFIYVVEDENLNFIYMNDQVILIKKDNNIEEIWILSLTNSSELTYQKVENNNEQEYLVIKENEINNENKKEKYNLFLLYTNNYLINN